MRVKDFTKPILQRVQVGQVDLPYGKCPLVRTEQSKHFKCIVKGVEVEAHVVNCGIDSESEKA